MPETDSSNPSVSFVHRKRHGHCRRVNDRNMQEGISDEKNRAYRLVGGLVASCQFSKLCPEQPQAQSPSAQTAPQANPAPPSKQSTPNTSEPTSEQQNTPSSETMSPNTQTVPNSNAEPSNTPNTTPDNPNGAMAPDAAPLPPETTAPPSANTEDPKTRGKKPNPPPTIPPQN
jgi:hypothetical protein